MFAVLVVVEGFFGVADVLVVVVVEVVVVVVSSCVASIEGVDICLLDVVLVGVERDGLAGMVVAFGALVLVDDFEEDEEGRDLEVDLEGVIPSPPGLTMMMLCGRREWQEDAQPCVPPVRCATLRDLRACALRHHDQSHLLTMIGTYQPLQHQPQEAQCSTIRSSGYQHTIFHCLLLFSPVLSY